MLPCALSLQAIHLGRLKVFRHQCLPTECQAHRIFFSFSRTRLLPSAWLPLSREQVTELHSYHQHHTTITKLPASLQHVTTTSRPASNPSPLHSTTTPPTPRPPNNPHRNRIRGNHVLGRKLESRQHGPQRSSKEHHLAHSR